MIGVSGYVDFPASKGFALRVHYSETYDIASNTSPSFTITKVQVYSEQYGHTYWHYLNGTILVNGTTVVTMDSGQPTHEAFISVGAWVDVSGTFGSVSDIPHNSDGSKSITIAVDVTGIAAYTTVESGNGWKASGTQSVALTTIPRAAEITSAADTTLGDACNVKWTPKVASHHYKLNFSMGGWSYTTDAIHPNHTNEYTYRSYIISLEAAEAIPNAKTGTMTVELYTYSDSGATEQIGDTKSATFMVTVPENDDTRPDVSMILTPVSALPDAFAGLYIQGKTKIQAELSAFGMYDATIESYSMKAENVTYDGEDSFTSEYLATNGETTITGYATDSRGITGSITEVITVLPYIKPKIMPAGGESDVIISRCDAQGNLISNGTYLKIKAKRSYSLLKSEGVQYNHCSIQYRYKLASAESYSDWVTILDGNILTSDEVDSEPLLGGVLSVKSTYMVEVRVIDDIGEIGHTMIYIPTDTVYMHRTKNALGLGKYVEGENLLDVAWDAHFRGEVLIGDSGMTLKEFILAVISEGG